ncbi:hypothetical protein MPH_05016 [Macrophomina phaseolina MS6]|uniref:Uncharacterized protein n=1 Tax=Macrophomina phaseolina (strain MS6) TaxID=1126212 RepID=K2RYG5_MACPH|nr:hypothetical protein MPH_05016 [Macrophomina phaseolina MS6]
MRAAWWKDFWRSGKIHSGIRCFRGFEDGGGGADGLRIGIGRLKMEQEARHILLDRFTWRTGKAVMTMSEQLKRRLNLETRQGAAHADCRCVGGCQRARSAGQASCSCPRRRAHRIDCKAQDIADLAIAADVVTLRTWLVVLACWIHSSGFPCSFRGEVRAS